MNRPQNQNTTSATQKPTVHNQVSTPSGLGVPTENNQANTPSGLEPTVYNQVSTPSGLGESTVYNQVCTPFGLGERPIYAQPYNPPGLGDPAPDFTAMTTQGVKRLSNCRGKWVILFSHPADFTPVCTTEFIAFAQRAQDFADRNAVLLGLSIDSNSSHIAWVINIYRNTGVEIPFPIIEDRDMAIAKKYGMIQPGVSSTETVRTVFFIDPKGIIRAKLAYPLTNGRNIGEILRLLDALQTTDAEKVATPANWRPGYPTVLPPPQTVQGAKARLDSGDSCMDWYLCYNTNQK